jgi:hypothetical protein
VSLIKALLGAPKRSLSTSASARTDRAPEEGEADALATADMEEGGVGVAPHPARQPTIERLRMVNLELMTPNDRRFGPRLSPNPIKASLGFDAARLAILSFDVAAGLYVGKHRCDITPANERHCSGGSDPPPEQWQFGWRLQGPDAD